MTNCFENTIDDSPTCFITIHNSRVFILHAHNYKILYKICNCFIVRLRPAFGMWNSFDKPVSKFIWFLPFIWKYRRFFAPFFSSFSNSAWFEKKIEFQIFFKSKKKTLLVNILMFVFFFVNNFIVYIFLLFHCK